MRVKNSDQKKPIKTIKMGTNDPTPKVRPKLGAVFDKVEHPRAPGVENLKIDQHPGVQYLKKGDH